MLAENVLRRMTPVFSLCYTTVRPAEIFKVCSTWLGRATKPHDIEIVLSVDLGGPAVEEGRRVAQRISDAGFKCIFVLNPGKRDCVTGWNAAAENSTGDIIIGVADDFEPPNAWDAKLLSLEPFGWWRHEAVVAVSDGYNPDIFTLAILTRQRYARFGYMFWPGYESMFCDTEMTAVAIEEHAVIDGRHLLFEHMHPDAGKRDRDAADLHHASRARWQRGEALFNYRKSAGFPVAQAETAPPEYTVFVLAIRDDFCLEVVIRRVIESAANHGITIKAVNVFTPTSYWSQEPTPEAHIGEVKAVVSALSDVQDVSIRHYIGAVKFAGFNSRIDVETAFRNHCLKECQKQTPHTLIVDGDELWHPDFIAKLNELVVRRRPTSVFTGMVPVVGLPGFPVDKAKDKAAVYVAGSSSFAQCRGCTGLRIEMPGYDVMHFTATRRTMQEIVDKHLNSGHADDPDYDMQGWVDNILLPGKLVPGFTNAHMYKPYQVWELIRDFTPTEWDQIPESIKPYLGHTCS